MFFAKLILPFFFFFSPPFLFSPAEHEDKTLEAHFTLEILLWPKIRLEIMCKDSSDKG